MVAPQVPGDAPDSYEHPLERLVVVCLERMEVQGERALEDLCREHPEFADALRAEIATLQALGLIEPTSDSAPAYPERLGEFKLLRRLGSGGMGAVFAALQEPLGRSVALKLIRPEQLLFTGHRERFRREIDAVARMHHPGIVPIYTVGEERGVPYFAMELIDGCTLAEVIRTLRTRVPEKLDAADLHATVALCARGADGQPSSRAAAVERVEGSWVETCLRLAQEVAEALDHAHENGIVHRDVKPSNIAVTRSGRALLFDFGLASLAGASRVTRTGAQPGSLPYMSPEQVRGESAIDARSDVYSLGVTLYELLTLRAAFLTDSSEVTRKSILDGRPPRIASLNRAVARDAETVCTTAMEPDPERRYATAAAFARDLGNVLAHRPIEARRLGFALRTRRWSQRHPVAATVSALASTAVLVSVSAFAWTRALETQEVDGLVALARAQASEGRLDEAIETTGHALGIRPRDVPALQLRDQLLLRSRNEFRRLAHGERLRDLIRDEDRLWPASAERVAELRAWLADADELVASLDEHRASLRESAERLREDPGQSRRDQGLQDLVAGLVQLSPLIARVRERLDFASSIEARSVSGSEALARWQSASDDIARLPAYGGLKLAPQLGLLPSRRDPDSGLWEFVHLQTGAAPAIDATNGALCIDANFGVVLVLLPGGSFQMGSDPTSSEHPPGSPYADPDHRPSEGPVHEIKLAPFFLSKFEMTQAQWRRVTGNNPSVYKSPAGQGGTAREWKPVENVSWDDCERWLARIGLELPTEAQWEYACRAGTSSVYSAGNDLASLCGVANIADDSLERVLSPPRQPYERNFNDGHTAIAPVGSYARNAWGFHDMHGNVWEWCRETAFGTTSTPYVLVVRAGDGLRYAPDTTDRVARGGSFESVAASVRCAARSSQRRDEHTGAQGVRPSRALDD